jgi:uncharacterized protein (DUF1499 family)
MNKQISIAILSFVFLMGCSGTIPKLGVGSGQFMPCPEKPNCVNSQATDKEHFIQTISFSGTPKDAQVQLLQLIKASKRTKIIDVQDTYIRVEFTSTLFRFVDDVEFYFPLTNTENTIIHFRSASRIGHSDFGANRERIEQIKNNFKVN